MDEFDEREFREGAGKIRPHSNFFDLLARDVQEVGVVVALLDNLPFEDLLAGVRDTRAGKPDPPDVIGTRTGGGTLVALEVTELMDQDVPAHQRARGPRDCRAGSATIEPALDCP